MDPAIVVKIHERLAAVERDHRVVIPLAVESGSRAWGFPSPDSDYDCRFVYVRQPEDYLSPWRKRDVIETIRRQRLGSRQGAATAAQRQCGHS